MADFERGRQSEEPQKDSLLRELGNSSREAVKLYFKPLITIYEYVKGKKSNQPSSGKKE